MLEKKEIVVLMNGSMIGTTLTAIDNLVLLARDFNQDNIHLFISTWDYESNNEWLSAALDRIKFLNHSKEIIKVTTLQEPYNSPSAYNYYNEFQTRLGLESDHINYHVSKRLFYFYTLVQGLKKINEYNSECSVLRLVSNVDVITDYPPFSFTVEQPNLKNTLLDSYYNRLPKLVPPVYQGCNFSDILFSPTILPYYIEEKIWFTSISLAKKIYSTDLKESLNRLIEYYLTLKKERESYPKKLTTRQLDEFFTDRFSTPVDTGITISYLVKKYAPDTVLMQISDILGSYNILDELRNPWLEISLEGIKETLPLHLKGNPHHLLNLSKTS